LAHTDVDGVCASKILQSLFKTDHILYSLVPVSNKEDLKVAVNSHKDKVTCIILINCGGCIDLTEELKLPDEVVVFVADYHRPLHVCNIYSREQICILSELDNDEEVPAFEDVFREDEDSSSDEEDSEDPEELGDKLERRRQRRLWVEARSKLLFDYTQFAYTSGSSAVVAFRLAWRLSADSSSLLWPALVAHAGEANSSGREPSLVALEAAELNTHVSRLNHAGGPDGDSISFARDLQLSLYRHWSLIDALKHTPMTLLAFKVWSHEGDTRMKEFLADLGLPLREARQPHCAMDGGLRGELVELLGDKCGKYGLPELVAAGFTRRQHHTRSAARDAAAATLALLEQPERSAAACFLDACDALSDGSAYSRGVALAQAQARALCQQTHAFVKQTKVVSPGPFLYACVEPGSAGAQHYSGPHGLAALGRLTLAAHVAECGRRNRRSRQLPLVITAPAPDPLWCLLCGVPPLNETSCKNLLGKAFEQAAEKSNARVKHDYFDTHVIQLNVEDRVKFMESLLALLTT